ncbi:MAG: hypothetical protein ACRC5T_12575 [Cetobacterium sp.]
MYEIKNIKKQLPNYYKKDSYLNSFFLACYNEFDFMNKNIELYKNITSIINCPTKYLFLLEKEEGLFEVKAGLLKYLSNPLEEVEELKQEGNIKIAYEKDVFLGYIDYTFKRRERLICKNFIKCNVFNNENFRKMTSILGVNYVSLKWDKETALIDVLVARDEEIDAFNSTFILEMLEKWIPYHLKFGAIYSTLVGQVVSDFKYEELETKIYRNIEEMIYTREIKENENGGIRKWLQRSHDF